MQSHKIGQSSISLVQPFSLESHYPSHMLTLVDYAGVESFPRNVNAFFLASRVKQ